MRIEDNSFVRRGKLPIRSISTALAAMRRQLGSGRQRTIEGDALWARMKLTEWRTEMGQETHAPFPARHEMKFHTPCGDVWLANPEFLSILSGIQIDCLSGSVSPALRELAIAALPDGFLAAWGGTWQYDPIDDEDASERVTLLLEAIDTESIRHAAIIRMRPHSLASMLADPRWSPIPVIDSDTTLLDDCPLHARCRIGNTRLSAHSLSTLRAGDAVLIQLPYFDANAEGVVSVGASGMHVRWPDSPSGQLEFLGWSPPHTTNTGDDYQAHEQTTRRSAMTESSFDTPTASEDGLDTTPLDDIPLTLAFIVGTLSTTVGKLRSMAPGNLIDLQEYADGRVTIEANGQIIGHGELVDIDGQLAVEIKCIGGQS